MELHRQFLNKPDNQEVQTFLSELRGVLSIEDIQKLANEDEQVKKWLQSEKDSFFSRGLETWITTRYLKIAKKERL